MAPVIRRIYDQMLDPKWAISMGACCSSMGVFNNYSLVPADKFMPIDVHVPGCPPRPEALAHGILRLPLEGPGPRAGRGGGGALRRKSAPRSSCQRQTAEVPTSASWRPETPPVPDATGLELYAQELRDTDTESILDTEFHRNRATLIANPEKIKPVLEALKGKGYTFLASLHGVDYYPDEPRLGVLYELLDMERPRPDQRQGASQHRGGHDRLGRWSVFPAQSSPEREVYDMFGVVFEGHPDLRRLLMPEDYQGFPQRRDFPVGGEPVLFTFNEESSYGKDL